MYYPKHQIRSYCLYLGSMALNNRRLDMGVYEHPDDGGVSHAIVFGEEDNEYMSGIIDFKSPEFNFQGEAYKINKQLYEDYLWKKCCL
jgi:hypothetical protein